jgi:molecular chaperone GrpE
MPRHRNEDEREDTVESVEVEDTSALLTEIDVLRSQLEEQKQIAEDEHDRHLRVLADFANYRRRRDDESQRHLDFANQELILKLLPVIDNFERAARAAEETESFDALAEGVNLTLRLLHDILEREGIASIEAVGEEFDPMRHEAVMKVESDEYPENTVVQEVEKGYTLKDRVIRPARVAVSQRG